MAGLPRRPVSAYVHAMRAGTTVVIALLFLVSVFAPGMSARSGREPATNPALLHAPWKARWIRPEGASPSGFGVYHLGKAFNLEVRPDAFVVHVSADNRYELFVNGTRVLTGPA